MPNLFLSERYFKSKVSTQTSPLNHLLTLFGEEILLGTLLQQRQVDSRIHKAATLAL